MSSVLATVMFTEPDDEVTMFSFVTDRRKLRSVNIGGASIVADDANLRKLAAKISSELDREAAACE